MQNMIQTQRHISTCLVTRNISNIPVLYLTYFVEDALSKILC